MQHFKHILTFILSFYGFVKCEAQVEKIRIETYYVSDADDATDQLGGHLEEGSVTYRLYADLVQGSKLRSIFGAEHHPLIFNSTLPFFNHLEEGVSFGKDLSRNRYQTGTVPLDTYLTLGQNSRTFSGSAYFGIPKDQDTDGSLVGGSNNDGGTEAISDGLLKNKAAEAGIPITDADGIMVYSVLPSSWVDIGFIDIGSGEDTTIFGAPSVKTTFYSASATLKNSGVSGVVQEKNEVFLGQFTTKGEISFELNLEVELPPNGIEKVVKYVARNEFLEKDEVFLPLLKYPYECGCTDPAYLEASTTFGCTDNSKCLTPVVLGCMDSLACNYDPNANLNIQDICCYVGYCHDLDISAACPDLKPREDFSVDHVSLIPNPVMDVARLTIDYVLYADIQFIVMDATGQQVQRGVLSDQERAIDLTFLTPGFYVLKLAALEKEVVLPLVKI